MKAIDFSFEQESVLIAESVKLQALLASHDAYASVIEHTRKASILTHTENAIEDLQGGFADLRSEIEGYYEKIEAELDRREAKREREHERIESGKLINAVAAE